MKICAISHIWQETIAKRMKIHPCYIYQRQKCRPVTVVSGNIRRKRIFAGNPLWRSVKWQRICRRR